MSPTPNEYTLVEKPILDTLGAMTPAYRYIHPSQHPSLRARENEVLFKPLVIDALVRIHNIPRATAEAVFNELAGLTRYVQTDPPPPPIDVKAEVATLQGLMAKRDAAEARMVGFLKELGYAG